MVQCQPHYSTYRRVGVTRSGTQVSGSEVNETLEESLEGEERRHQHQEDEVILPSRDLIDPSDLRR